MQYIVVIDYNMGNLHSVSKALERVAEPEGFRVKVSNDRGVISRASAIVFPGVGAFGKGMENLKSFGLADVLKERVKERVPFLGICLGLQLLFTESEEHGSFKGLDILAGEVIGFSKGVKVPHMGWNRVEHIEEEEINKGSGLFRNILDRDYFYFVHSYFVLPDDKDIIIAKVDYGNSIAAAVNKDNIYGVQFHPEKSGDSGIALFSNFVEIVKGG
ncbi:MAG: imidazole glycerol phosphate synthase subunit HisH [Candidatus Kaelpia imicola]|nr:imidazole glycerol phosphate synthase subunit HisH [Candidatus Kaelpia imicola]